MVAGLKGGIGGRGSAALGSDRNGSGPPPSYANTSRAIVVLAAESAGAESDGALVVSGLAWAASPAAASQPASARLVARIRGPPRAVLRARLGAGRRRRLHERPDDELRLEQGAQRVRQVLLRLRRRGLEQQVLRHDDARQARHVRQEFADLVVVPDHGPAIAGRVKRLARLDLRRAHLR